MYYSILYWYHKQEILFFQELNDCFAMCSSCSCILFAFIKRKRVKHSIICATVKSWWGWSMVCGTEMFKFDALNIVFRLNLLYKNGYYTLYLILTTQYIFVRLNALRRVFPHWRAPIMCKYSKFNTSFYIAGM